RLHRGELGRAVVVLEPVVQRLEQLIGREIAQQVHLDATRPLRQNAGKIAGFGREVEAAHVDFEDGFRAYPSAVQRELLAADGSLVRELDAADVGGEHRYREASG